MPICDPMQTLLICLSLWKQTTKIIYPVETFHIGAETIIHSSHQVTLHGKEGPNLFNQDWVSSTQFFTNSLIYEKEQGLILHLIFITPFLYFFCNGTSHWWHKMTQVNSKIFRHVRPCSSLHVHYRGTNFCINWRASHFPSC